MFFLSQFGIIKYDGASWELISSERTPVEIHADSSSDNLFMVDESGIGFFERNDYGDYEYSIITSFDKDSIIDVKSKNLDNNLLVWFGKQFYIINTSTHKLEFSTKFNDPIDACLIVENRIVVNVKSNDESCFYYNGKTFVKQNEPSFFNYGDVLFDFSFNESKILIGTSNSLLLICNSQSIVDKIEMDYLKNNFLKGGIELSEKKLAFSTLSGGIIVVDKISKKTVEVINFQNGLPDDEIIYMFKDNVGGLWVSHGLGLSKIELNIPIRNLGVYPGILGEKTSVSFVDGRVYVGTNEGLFYLSKVKYLNEVTHYIKKEAKVTQDIETFSVIREVNRVIRLKAYEDPNKEKEYGIREIPVTFKIPVDSVVSKITNEFKDNLVRGNYAMVSIPYIYRRINGLNARCNNLSSFRESSLLVSANTGLWIVNNLEVSPLIEKDNITKVFIMPETDIIHAVSESKLYRLSIDTNNKISDKRIIELPDQISSFAIHEGEVFFTYGNKIFKINEFSPNSINTEEYSEVKRFDDDVEVMSSQGKMFVLIQKQLYPYDSKILVKSKKYMSPDNSEFTMISSQDNFLWNKEDNEFKLINGEQKGIFKYLNLFSNIDIIYSDDNNNLWVINDNQLYQISDLKESDKFIPFNIEVNKITDTKGTGLNINEINLSYNSNALKLSVSPNYYLSEKGIRYSYFIHGIDKEWTNWSENSVFEYRYLPPGNYEISARAINILGKISESDPIIVYIEKPFWRSTWFIILTITTLFLLAWFFSYLRTKKLEKSNRILQEKIQLATAEIVSQKDKLEVAYKDIENKNKHITQSINYAQTIQEGILVDEEEIKQVMPDFFLINNPMNIVSGDFYWFQDFKDFTIIIAADCTGHGVPGAFMSMIGNTLLNQIINYEGVTDPGQICKRLDQEIVNILKQDKNESSYDGMDISVCKNIKNKNELHFCGAYNDLIYFKNNEMNIVPAERYSIGGVYRINKEFETKIIDETENSSIYIFSDGYQDQFGGPFNEPKKFKSKNFKMLLKGIHQLEPALQKQILEDEMSNWLGDNDQIDDILVIGFKL
jgi:serine phosphatase RsbU (regulator of sigma subunit)